ncbi:MAG: helix-turn-helix domain-containing protein [bacterium]
MEPVNTNIRLYSIAAAAKQMNIGRKNLTKLIDNGELGVNFIGKQRKVSHIEIERYLKESARRKLIHFSNKPNNEKQIHNSDLNKILTNIIRSSNHEIQTKRK